MKNLLLVAMIALTSLHTYAVENELTFRCKFSDGQSTNYDDGMPNSKRSEFTDVVFDKINVKKGIARIIGNNGVVDILVMAGSESIHLIERTATGNMSIATIFTSQKFSKVNSYPVVLSRHMSLSASPITSQYRGLCRLLN